MKKKVLIFASIIIFFSCLPKKNPDFNGWIGLKVGQLQSGPVEKYTKKEMDNLTFKVVDSKEFMSLVNRFEEIDSTEIPIWFDNMMGVVALSNGDSLILNLGFPTALFRNTKTRKVYILENKYYKRQWENVVFGELILQ